jgi:hypothetical protein
MCRKCHANLEKSVTGTIVMTRQRDQERKCKPHIGVLIKMSKVTETEKGETGEEQSQELEDMNWLLHYNNALTHFPFHQGTCDQY